MLGNLGFTEIVILLLVLLLVFGARRIPEIGASIGQGIKEFKRSLRDVSEDESRNVPPSSSSSSSSSLPPAPGGEPKRLSQ
jgi:sec-independent protein translocase protein TatA